MFCINKKFFRLCLPYHFLQQTEFCNNYISSPLLFLVASLRFFISIKFIISGPYSHLNLSNLSLIVLLNLSQYIFSGIPHVEVIQVLHLVQPYKIFLYFSYGEYINYHKKMWMPQLLSPSPKNCTGVSIFSAQKHIYYFFHL